MPPFCCKFRFISAFPWGKVAERMRGRMREIPFSNTGKSLQSARIVSFAPAFLISQKSQIFDSFPPGEAFYKSKFEIVNFL